LPLPAVALRAIVQPVAAIDLATVAAAIVDRDAPSVIDCVGPRPLTLGDFIASLREQLGAARARVIPLPAWLSRLTARCGDFLPFQPWCSESLALLEQDNVGDASAFMQWLGRAPIAPQDLVRSTWAP
jgi:uncharacterized protein YbjT (DUF2867 family)